MTRELIRTGDDRTATMLRLALGSVILPHGLQKALGWFGGAGIGGTVQYFDQALGVPVALTVLVIAAESLGAIGLIAGFLSRVAAAGVALVMAGAVVLVHGRFGFFMNWGGVQAGEGFEYHILALALALGVMVKGSGALSADRVLSERLESRACLQETTAAASRRAA
ncbi:MAG: DoxX family protein [Gemmatimonadetes bacterium]|nr:DoxX family protein [Gemmatimonadota bacterium]